MYRFFSPFSEKQGRPDNNKTTEKQTKNKMIIFPLCKLEYKINQRKKRLEEKRKTEVLHNDAVP